MIVPIVGYIRNTVHIPPQMQVYLQCGYERIRQQNQKQK